MEIVLNSMNACWDGKQVPDDWHKAVVTATRKKGALDRCENYRPINLLNLGYKIFAALIRKRLLEGGAEARLSSLIWIRTWAKYPRRELHTRAVCGIEVGPT